MLPAEFDQEDLLNRLAGDDELARNALTIFLDDASNRLTALTEAVRDSRAAAVQKEAHTIKGAAANVSALQVRELALQMELLGRSGQIVEAMRILPELTASFERTSQVIKQFCDDLSSTPTR